MTTDDLKLARDGHTATSVFTTLGDGFGVVEWR